jgi:hypothetical protein
MCVIAVEARSTVLMVCENFRSECTEVTFGGMLSEFQKIWRNFYPKT